MTVKPRAVCSCSVSVFEIASEARIHVSGESKPARRNLPLAVVHSRAESPSIQDSCTNFP